MKLPSLELKPIGVIETDFKEKFGIPRQPGLVREARGVIHLLNDPNLVTALKGLEAFSHLWIVFWFHETGAKAWKPSVRPPRLGGAKKVGVLASRSPHRPNPIGLSVVELVRVEMSKDGPRVLVKGVDILDGTPVFDIKPYIAYADSVPDAVGGWAKDAIPRARVLFLDKAMDKLNSARAKFPHLKKLIEEMLSIDPRPAFQKRDIPMGSDAALDAQFGIRILDYDVKWEIKGDEIVVTDLVELNKLISKLKR